MIRLNLISSDKVRCEWLQELKRYASVPDDSQDALLRSLMKRAALEVQEYADSSLLACSFRLDVTGNEESRIRLYQTVSEVVSVTGGDGVSLGYSLSGSYVTLSVPSETVSIIYDTVPDEAEVGRLLPVAIRYATALYDGQDDIELTKIIQEIC